MELRVRNVNGALRKALTIFKLPGVVERAVRGTKTLEWGDPVITIYQKPRERVLFCPERDANPFFHLFESVWMLAGRDDVNFPATIVKRMAEFSDDGKRMQGAYGYRWRRLFEIDQLAEIIQLLKNDPDTRRAVMAMWNPTTDLPVIKSKDIPCNTHLYFKVRDGKLDLTICCRSNDVIWGAYGANAVHFSILQEYVANKIYKPLGRMIQVSDSFHVYTEGGSSAVWNKVSALPTIEDPYAEGLESMALGARSSDWDEDMWQFFNTFDNGFIPKSEDYRTTWWRTVFIPMWRAWYHRDIGELNHCDAEDWDEAGKQWLKRHPKKEVVP